MKKSIGDICEILNGYSFKSEKYTNEGVRVIRIANVQNGYIEDATPQFYPNSEIDSFKDFLLQKNDLLISLTGNVGRVALLDEKFLPAALNQRVACLRPKSTAVSTKFLFYALSSERFIQDCEDSARGVAQKNMSTEWLKKYFINLPDAGTQLYWIKTLDVVTELIKKRKLQLRYLDQLASSRFIEMFGDVGSSHFPIVALEDLFKVGSSKRILQSEQVKYGVPFLRISDLIKKIDDCFEAASLFISDQKFLMLKQNGDVPAPGDILITSRGTLGRCYIVKQEDRFYFQDGMISWLSPKDSSISNIYLVSLFKQIGVKKQISKMLAGSTVDYLSIAMLKKLQVVLPPLELQNKFAAFVEQLDKSKVTIRKSIEKLETTYRALLQDYFEIS